MLPVVAIHIKEKRFQNASMNDVIAIIIYTTVFCIRKIQPDTMNVNASNKAEYLELKKGWSKTGKCWIYFDLNS